MRCNIPSISNDRTMHYCCHLRRYESEYNGQSINIFMRVDSIWVATSLVSVMTVLLSQKEVWVRIQWIIIKYIHESRLYMGCNIPSISNDKTMQYCCHLRRYESEYDGKSISIFVRNDALAAHITSIEYTILPCRSPSYSSHWWRMVWCLLHSDQDRHRPSCLHDRSSCMYCTLTIGPLYWILNRTNNRWNGAMIPNWQPRTQMLLWTSSGLSTVSQRCQYNPS